MRCIIVNGANLKAGDCCAHCGNNIGESYIREIGTRQIYCDYRCYSGEVELPIIALGYRTRPLNSGMFGS